MQPQTHIQEEFKSSKETKDKRQKDIEALDQSGRDPQLLKTKLSEDDAPEFEYEMLKQRIHGGIGQRKIAVSLRLDPDILDWLKSESEKQMTKGYQTYINSILREVMNMSLYGHLINKK
jgi:uncharacterized protein (DUF4415 family)